MSRSWTTPFCVIITFSCDKKIESRCRVAVGCFDEVRVDVVCCRCIGVPETAGDGSNGYSGGEGLRGDEVP